MDRKEAERREKAITAARRALLTKLLAQAKTPEECLDALCDLDLYSTKDRTGAVREARARAIELASSYADISAIFNRPEGVGIFDPGDLAESFYGKAMQVMDADRYFDLCRVGFLTDDILTYLINGLRDAKKLTRIADRITSAPGLSSRRREVLDRAAELVNDWESCTFVGDVHPGPLPVSFINMAIVYAEQQDGYGPVVKVCDWIKSSQEAINLGSILEATAYMAELESSRERIRLEAEKRLRAAYERQRSPAPEGFEEAWRIIRACEKSSPMLSAELYIEFKRQVVAWSETSFLDLSLRKSNPSTALWYALRMQEAGDQDIMGIVAGRVYELAESFDDHMALLGSGDHPDAAAENALCSATTEKQVLMVLQHPSFLGEWTVPLCQQIFDERWPNASSIEDYLVLHHLTKDPTKLAEVEEKVQELIAPFMPTEEETEEEA